MQQNNLNFNNANYEKKFKTEEKIYYLNFKINFFIEDPDPQHCN